VRSCNHTRRRLPETNALDRAAGLDGLASAAVAADTLSPLHHAQAILGAFDAKDIGALAALVTDDVRLQIGNADVVKGKREFVEALQVFLGSVASFRLRSSTCGVTATP